MDWIAGIERDPSGRICVASQWLDGRRTSGPLEQLNASLPLRRTSRRRAVIPLHNLRVGDTGHYLDGLGLNALDPSGQPVYELTCEAGDLVIPAQTLVLAAFGMNSQFRQVLLHPRGPGYLMSASISSNDVSVRPTPRRRQKMQLEHHSMATRMEWILSYQSAQAAWCSVYQHALRGRFDMAMPQAIVHAVVWTRPVGQKSLVTSMTILKLFPAEESHEFASGRAKREFAMNKSVFLRPTHGIAAAPAKDKRLLNIDGVQPLDDEQWARIKPIVHAVLKVREQPVGAPRVCSLRALVDVMLLKLGTPYAWSKVPAEKSLVQGASVLLSKLQRAGTWERVISEYQSLSSGLPIAAA